MEKKIIKILSEVRPEFDFLKSDNFIAEGLLDSFDIVQVVTALDNEFKISIEGTDIKSENFISVDSLMKLIKKNRVTI